MADFVLKFHNKSNLKHIRILIEYMEYLQSQISFITLHVTNRDATVIDISCTIIV